MAEFPDRIGGRSNFVDISGKGRMSKPCQPAVGGFYANIRDTIAWPDSSSVARSGERQQFLFRPRRAMAEFDEMILVDVPLQCQVRRASGSLWG